MTKRLVVDRFGKPVAVGDRVRVVSIPADAIHGLHAQEHAQVCSMLGEIFEIYEIDIMGNVCVEKWWHPSPTRSFTHGLTLASAEFERT